MKTTHIILQFLLLIAFDNVLSEDTEDYLEVNITSGKVKGYRQDGIYQFYGIPYATAPTGVDKFKAPLPAPVWLQTLEATNKYIVCPQNTNFFPFFYGKEKVNVKEDCLVANVYVPSTKEENVPVIVIVHGGAYQIGAGNYITPTDIAAEGKFIAVTFNYRLGVHGFLCLGTEDVPGNAGMKDMVALLRWVKQNIAKFGGNPKDVTIIGNSAGSSAVDMLMLSEAAKGLFSKVIPESGNAVSVWSVQIDPLKNAKDYAQKLNFTTDDVYKLEEFYKTTTLDILTSDSFLNKKESTFVMVPCVERFTGQERFLKDSPYNILKKGAFTKVPYLVGFANMEGLFRAPLFSIWKNAMNENFANFLPADLKFENADEKKKIATTVKEFYFGTNQIDENNKQGYVDYFSDVMFVYPAMRTVNFMVQAGSKSVYLYEYSFTDKTLPIPRPFPDIEGADHCAQTFNLYKSTWTSIEPSKISDNFKQMHNTLSNLWINFIQSGQPVSETSDTFPSGWPTTSSNGSPYMDLNLTPKLMSTPIHKARMEFWDSIYQKYYSAPVPPPAPEPTRVDL